MVLDAVRAKSVSAYGLSTGPTPHLDAFADENVLFKRAYSSGTWTIPTHTSMLTGLYLSQHRIESTKADRYLNDDILTLPAALESQGYRTAAFSQNFLFSPKYQFAHFQEFHDMDEVWRSNPLLPGILSGSDALQNAAATRYLRKITGLRRFLDAMLDWIKSPNQAKPLFLMANVANAHYPWAPPPDMLLRQAGFDLGLLRNREMFAPKPYQFNSGKRAVTTLHRRSWSALYHAALMHVDREVGRFLRRLRRWSGWSNTIVVITADHGEMLGDYEDLIGHMLSLHDNLLHVPLMVRHPEYPRGIVAERVVQNLDLYSSIIEWSACPTAAIPAAQLQRPGLSAAMETPHDSSGFAFAEEDFTDSYDPIGGLLRANPRMSPTKFPRQQIAVHTATHKYVWSNDHPARLYDLESDPDENMNLNHAQTPAAQTVLKDLHQKMESWRAGLECFPPNLVNNAPQVDPVTMERLRNLGYVE